MLSSSSSSSSSSDHQHHYENILLDELGLALSYANPTLLTMMSSLAQSNTTANDEPTKQQEDSSIGTTDNNLESRLIALERKRFQCPDTIDIVNESMRRSRYDVEQKYITSARWKWVPPNYYSFSLQERAKLLGVPSTYYLCKSLLLENKKYTSDNNIKGMKNDSTNPRYVMVMLQYEATLDNRKLINAIRSKRSSVQDRLDVNAFDFRVASNEDNDRLTGYAFNSVTPFGMLRPNDIQLIVAEAIVPLNYFWMGGGHVHLKLGMAVSDFVRTTQAWIADVSSPRTTTDDDNIDL